MAMFYVFPSRHLLGQRYSEMLTKLFPDIAHTPWDWPELAEALAHHVEGQGTAYVVFREDLDDSVKLKDALIAHFGAATEDDVREISLGGEWNENIDQDWSAPIAAA